MTVYIEMPLEEVATPTGWTELFKGGGECHHVNPNLYDFNHRFAELHQEQIFARGLITAQIT